MGRFLVTGLARVNAGEPSLDKENALSDAYAAMEEGQLERTRELAHWVLATVDEGDIRYEARALACLAHCDRVGSKLRRASDAARRAAQLFEQLGDEHGEAHALTIYAHVTMLLGRNEEAVEAAILATRLCDVGPPRPQTVAAYNCLGLAYCWSGDHARADAALEKAVQIAQSCQPALSIYQPRLNQVWVEAARLVDERYQTGRMQGLGKLDRLMKECLALERAGQGMPMQPGLRSMARTISLASTSLVAIWQRDFSAARDVLAAASDSLSDSMTWLDSFVRWCHAELAWVQEDWPRAENELKAMREMALTVEHEQLACMADLLLAQVYEWQNQEAAVRLAYRRLRQRERRVVAEGLGSRESLVSWRLGARQSERHLQQALMVSKKFERWSLEDALTGIANRRYFEQSLAERIAASVQSGRPLSVAMVDVDRFKTVNDRFTHSVGDRVLKTVAAIISAEMRQDDLPARWAGDEFVVLFNNTTEQQAEHICLRIRRAVAGFEWGSVAPGLSMSVSIGISQVQPDDTVESALHRSDEAMYSRKSPDLSSAN
ncbi:hypothetical protein RD110_22465 [Rhodoferax koreense]|uniref:diguanylate cyclase n=1 Tax=Rhodoferax koreensis TaxID=1842727 RepID=A0A1P8K0U9_9BURK|nr:tetratricopeptide repeat-containing diguanylate cyclase [Rhodoferax koreense]APW39629.1 hypothetical protein RD110_22465 [Rhodoferax koreense]